MTAIPPVNILGASQPDKGFIHKGGRLEGMAWTFRAEAAASDLAKVRHQRFKQRWFCLRIPFLPAA